MERALREIKQQLSNRLLNLFSILNETTRTNFKYQRENVNIGCYFLLDWASIFSYDNIQLSIIFFWQYRG